ncbi:MAG: ATP-binding protein [Solirubrobacteraceae bacterium]
MRRSLLVRLSLLTLVVIVLSVAATAWLATLILNQGINRANRSTRAEVATVYRALLHYGATHRGWAGVTPLVQDLASRAALQIELAGLSDRTLAVARTGARRLPAGSPVAVIDPLHVDPTLYPRAPASRIDPAAVGPLRLTTADRAKLDNLTEEVLSCVRAKAGGGRVSVTASGRPVVSSRERAAGVQCGTAKVATAFMPDQEPAADALIELTDVCLKTDRLPDVTVLANFTWMPPSHRVAARRATQRCLDAARREQLSAWVAPAAVLYITVPSRQRTALVFSAQNERRIAETAMLVIALAMGATLLAGGRLVRPLRALTAAARGVEANDVTEVVEVSGDDEIAHLTRAFNRMVRTQAQMQQQRQAAIGDIAHELRTPLANIRAWLEAARDGLAAKDETLIGSLLEEAMLLQRTVDDLQVLSLGDSGRFELQREDVSLLPLLRQAGSALAAPAEAAQVSINLDGPDVRVWADPDRLRQVLRNLVSNAIRHSRSGGSIDIHARVDGWDLVIDVLDRGAGIAAADLPHVFDRFWRAEKSRSRAAGGSGLGLAIVRQLVEAHGGTVSARSIPEQETVFSVRLSNSIRPGAPVAGTALPADPA